MNGQALNSVISIVEDNPTVRDSLVSLLEATGYAVRAYASGEDLLRSLDGNLPPLLILDVHLPDTDAFGVLDVLARHHSPLPATVLITGHGDESIERQAAERGLRLLHKPVDGHALIEALKQAQHRIN